MSNFWGTAYRLTAEDYSEVVVVNQDHTTAIAMLRDYAEVNGYTLEKIGSSFVQIMPEVIA